MKNPKAKFTVQDIKIIIQGLRAIIKNPRLSAYARKDLNLLLLDITHEVKKYKTIKKHRVKQFVRSLDVHRPSRDKVLVAQIIKEQKLL